MTRTMYDGVTAGLLPPDAEMVAGYVNGTYTWKTADWNRFTKAVRAGIDVNGTMPGGADVLDVETGDATVEVAVRWIQARKAKGLSAGVIYCNRSTLTPLFNAMAAAGLHVVRDFLLWIATLDGTKTVPDMTGVVAVQFENTSGWDQSVVYDDAWKPSATGPSVLHGVLVQLPAGQTRDVSSTDNGVSWR